MWWHISKAVCRLDDPDPTLRKVGFRPLKVTLTMCLCRALENNKYNHSVGSVRSNGHLLEIHHGASVPRRYCRIIHNNSERRRPFNSITPLRSSSRIERARYRIGQRHDASRCLRSPPRGGIRCETFSTESPHFTHRQGEGESASIMDGYSEMMK